MAANSLGSMHSSDRAALRSAVLLWVFGYLLVVGVVVLTRRAAEWPQLLAELPVFLCALGLAGLLYLVMHRLQAMATLLQLLAGGMFVIGAALALAWLNLELLSALQRLWLANPPSADALQDRLLSGRFFGYFWALSLNASIFWGHLASTRAARQTEALTRAELAAERAQLAALRFQLNPHFLFNSLNALSALVMEERTREAEAIIDKLSDFLRASIGADPNALISLEEELETVQAYLEIESVRFGERLAVEFDCTRDLLGAELPNFILQPLVENAVKYAVAPSKRVVTIRICARRAGEILQVRVEDDGAGSGNGAAKGSTGLGLRNVRERLAALYGSRGKLETAHLESGFAAVLSIPFQRLKNGALTCAEV